MDASIHDERTLDEIGYMVGCIRGRGESNDSLRHRIDVLSTQVIKSFSSSMIDDISNIGALVAEIETNLTWLPMSDMPPQSFRITVVGGVCDDIAQCIHDNRTVGVVSVGNTSGIAWDLAGCTINERFNHIETDHVLRAINFMEKWQQIVYDIQEAIEEND